MTNSLSCLAHLSDSELLAETASLAARERNATARLIASLAELDARRLYLAEGCSSLFTYCTQVLHLSEHAAYARIEAARAARKFPVILELLSEGAINLTTVGLLAPHLTAGNHRELLEAARHQSKRAVEHLIARLRPQPDVPSSVRKLPQPTAAKATPARRDEPVIEAPTPAGAPISASTDRATVAPLAPERYKVQFTVSRETYEKLRRVQDLLRHSVPNGDPAVIFDRALTLLLDNLEKKKLSATSRPRASRPAKDRSRHIPAGVKREVWKRDAGRCAFVGTNGRCGETGFLEFHHVVPYAEGGKPIVDNIELRCRAHNAYEAEQYFGPMLFVREGRAVFETDVTRSGPSPLSCSYSAHSGLVARRSSATRASARASCKTDLSRRLRSA